MESTGALLSGWGRGIASRSRLVRPGSRDDLEALFASAGTRGLLGRGLGRSYGDAAQLAGGTVIDCTELDRVLELDPEKATVRVEGGCSLETLLRTLLPAGFFVPVTPGTRHVSVGGAVAADVHGKNHHLDGSLGRHIEQLVLVTPEGTFEASPTQEAALLAATTGGMGLTGVVAEVTLRLLPVETSSMIVDTERAEDLEDCMAKMAEGDAGYRYSVAWVDCLARGRRLGRSVLSRGDHARLDQLPAAERAEPLAYAPRTLADLGPLPSVNVLSPALAACFNEAWFRRSPRRRVGEVQGITPFFHPLDALGGWNRLYGPRGFTQYQLVVPFGAESVIRLALERLAAASAPCYLGVLKRFGEQGSGHLSFPAPGWTLALDLPLGRTGLVEVLDGLDETVAAAGGRVYLAKDGRLRPELLGAMYPRLGAWQEVRRRVDPSGVLGSDLGARLGLCG